jgi:hypothetical protein
MTPGGIDRLMPNHDEPPQDIDLELLDRGSKALVGYFVQTWFLNYPGAASKSLGRLHERGFIETRPGRPSWAVTSCSTLKRWTKRSSPISLASTSTSMTCHKAANNRLMNRYGGKQVLFLRG